MGVAYKSVLASGGTGTGLHVDTLTITHNPNTLTYIKDEVIDTTGLVVTASASGMSGTVTQYCTVSPQILDTAGTQTVTVSYGDATATFEVTVYAVETVTITSQPTNRTYIVGDVLDLTGIAVRAVAGTITRTVTNICSYSPANGSIIAEDGTITITASFGGQSDTTTITSYAYSSIAFTTPPTKTLYNPYDLIDLTGAVVTGTAGTLTRDVTSLCTYNPAEGSEVINVGNFNITASLQGLTATTPYQVIAVDLVPFETGTWDQINAMLNAHYNNQINIYDHWNLGDEREFNVPSDITLLGGKNQQKIFASSTYNKYYIKLVSKNTKDLTTPIGEHTKCAFVAILYAKQSFDNGSHWNTMVLGRTILNNTASNVDAWKECDLRPLLNSTVKNGIDSDMVSIIKSFKNTQSKGGSDETIAKQTNTVDDYIALPSAKEFYRVSLPDYYYTEAEADNVTFGLYANSNAPDFYYNQYNQGGCWTRTAYEGDSTSYCYLRDGKTDNKSSANYHNNESASIVPIVVI